MLIYKSNHRYQLNDVQDTPVDEKQKSGMAGYGDCLGWFFAKIHIAICFHDDEGRKFYLNRNSAIKYINRHRDDPIDQQTKAEKVYKALFDLAISAISQPGRAAAPKPNVEEVSDSITPRGVTSIADLTQDAPHTEPTIPRVPPANDGLTFPNKDAEDQEISAWCEHATPRQFLENFETLVCDFHERSIFETVLPKAFKSICEDSTITDQEFLR